MNNLVTTNAECWSLKKAAVSLTLFSSADHRPCFSPQSQCERKLKPYTASVVNSGLLGTTRSISIHWLIFQYLGILPFFSINSHRTSLDQENKLRYFQNTVVNSHQHLSKHIWNNRSFKHHLFVL